MPFRATRTIRRFTSSARCLQLSLKMGVAEIRQCRNRRSHRGGRPAALSSAKLAQEHPKRARFLPPVFLRSSARSPRASRPTPGPRLAEIGLRARVAPGQILFRGLTPGTLTGPFAMFSRSSTFLAMMAFPPNALSLKNRKRSTNAAPCGPQFRALRGGVPRRFSRFPGLRRRG